ncbi:MAG: hypothetical protein J1F32_01205 [Erysipelotrichales bacterium]|nr:hypothetical protein [Erysipelotrichales bacterium]
MINWAYFPKTVEPDSISFEIIKVFQDFEKDISSENHKYKSDEVLKIVEKGFVGLSFRVEHSKATQDKIKVPVLYGINGKPQLSFEADAYNKQASYVIEVEAGRAVQNYQFLKDFYEACMMFDVNYLCIAVRNHYRKSKDFDKVYKFFDSLYASKRMEVPLKGILIIGY